MEQTIKIDVPDGKKAIYNDKTQTIEFVDIEPIRSKSWQEFCKNHPDANNEWCIDIIGHVLESESIFTDLRRVNANLATKGDAEGILALIQLTRLHDEWVGDWQPDYADHNTAKWHICFNSNYIDIASSMTRKRLLAFPTYDMAVEFIKYFRDLIWKAQRFI